MNLESGKQELSPLDSTSWSNVVKSVESLIYFDNTEVKDKVKSKVGSEDKTSSTIKEKTSSETDLKNKLINNRT